MRTMATKEASCRHQQNAKQRGGKKNAFVGDPLVSKGNARPSEKLSTFSRQSNRHLQNSALGASILSTGVCGSQSVHMKILEFRGESERVGSARFRNHQERRKSGALAIAYLWFYNVAKRWWRPLAAETIKI